MSFKIVKWEEKSLPGRPRYVIAEKETGCVLDDAFGYGYHSVESAEKAWKVKHHKPPATIEQVFRALDRGTWSINKVQMEPGEFEWRYIITDSHDDTSGLVLDDANGFGYTSPAAAYRGWKNKNRDFFAAKRRECLNDAVENCCWCILRVNMDILGHKPRYVVVDTRSNAVIDDAFGIGYATREAAEDFVESRKWEN